MHQQLYQIVIRCPHSDVSKSKSVDREILGVPCQYDVDASADARSDMSPVGRIGRQIIGDQVSVCGRVQSG